MPVGHGILLWFALKIIINKIDKEADALMDSESPFHGARDWTWDSLARLLLDSQQAHTMKEAPIIWTILSTIAVGKGRRTTREIKEEGRDPWQVTVVEALWRITLKPPQGAAVALSILLYLQNKSVALLPQVISVILFSCNANRFIYSLLSHLGISIAYSTINSKLHELGNSVRNSLKRIGDRIRKQELSVVWIYDNIQ